MWAMLSVNLCAAGGVKSRNPSRQLITTLTCHYQPGGTAQPLLLQCACCGWPSGTGFGWFRPSCPQLQDTFGVFRPGGVHGRAFKGSLRFPAALSAYTIKERKYSTHYQTSSVMVGTSGNLRVPRNLHMFVLRRWMPVAPLGRLPRSSSICGVPSASAHLTSNVCVPSTKGHS